MTTWEQIHAKFGVTAEAIQLFETELGTLILYIQGANNGWLAVPDPESAQTALDRIERSTLGGLVTTLKKQIGIDQSLVGRFDSALQARNRLNHGFFERHNLKIETDQGRNEMFAELEELHTELFSAWQIARMMMELATTALDGPAASE